MKTNTESTTNVTQTGDTTTIVTTTVTVIVTESGDMPLPGNPTADPAAQVAVQITALRASGKSLREIAGILNAHGLCTVRGASWGPQQVARVLNRYQDPEDNSATATSETVAGIRRDPLCDLGVPALDAASVDDDTDPLATMPVPDFPSVP
jgi:hypothetical protein